MRLTTTVAVWISANSVEHAVIKPSSALINVESTSPARMQSLDESDAWIDVRPLGQLVQEDSEPVWCAYWPAGQAMQLAAPVLGWYWPARQSLHALELVVT